MVLQPTHQRVTRQRPKPGNAAGGVAALLLATVGLPNPSVAAELTGEVVAIADGDTLTVLDAARTQHRVRLAAIDAPEKRQPFGNRARQYLAALTFRQPVTVSWHKLDRYGRKVGTVSTSAVPDVGLALLTAGLAWHHIDFAREQQPSDRAAYEAAQLDAQVASRGLWADPLPQPPWLFRKSLSTLPGDSRRTAAPARSELDQPENDHRR